MKKRVYRNWANVTAEWKASGKTKNDFCRQNGINRSVFDANLRRASLKPHADSGSPGVLQNIGSRSPLREALPNVGNQFIEVISAKSELMKVIRITTSAGCIVEVPL